MSLFSALCLLYPGVPPKLTAIDLRTFCEKLRAELQLGDASQKVRLRFGDSIDQDLETTQLMKQVGPGSFQFVKYPWDYEKESGTWEELWPSPKNDKQTIYRAFVDLGPLPKEVSRAFTAISPDQRFYIAPDNLSLQIAPFAPETLSEASDECLGFVHLSLSGNGHFTWRPLEKYWDQIRQAPSLVALQRLCRESLPVPDSGFPLEELQEDLGALFMNGADYRPSDWIVTVSETG